MTEDQKDNFTDPASRERGIALAENPTIQRSDALEQSMILRKEGPSNNCCRKVKGKKTCRQANLDTMRTSVRPPTKNTCKRFKNIGRN